MAEKIVELLDIMDINGNEGITRYHFVDTDGLADPADLRSQYLAHVVPATLPFMSSVVRHMELRTRTVYPTPDLVVEEAISPPQAGTLAGVPLPYTVTYSIKWVLGATTHLGAGPSGFHIKRGGKHLPGPTSGPTGSTGLYNGAEDSAIAAWFTALENLASENWQLCVFAPARTVPSARGDAYALVTGYSIRGFGTQTTRKPGRGA